MNRETIIEKARLLETKQDLLALLNNVMLDDMVAKGHSDMYHPFSMKHLNYYCNPNNTFHRYKQFYIKKKSGGQRCITAPRNRSFKLLLHYLNVILKAIYSPSEHAMGFAEGRSVVTNANVHTRQNYVFNIDLKDFFPSIEQARVWKRLQLAPFSFNQPIASLIAGLCAMRITDDNGVNKYILPQGSPTSPIVTNMICDKLDRRLAGVAKRFGLNYTRYADDITFSSMHNSYHEGGEFRVELSRIISSQGFTINEAKTRLQKKGCRQEVTGIIVSDKVNVTQRYVRNLRNLIYIWERYGYDSALNKFYPKYLQDKGHVKNSQASLINVLGGKLMYLKMVKGPDDSVYLKLENKFRSLVNSLNNPSGSHPEAVNYIETTPVLDFEAKCNTEIAFQSKSSENDSIIHRYASFSLGGVQKLASISKSLQDDDLQDKKELSISLCRKGKGDMFWLIHRSRKFANMAAGAVNIDELNQDLDYLLNR